MPPASFENQKFADYFFAGAIASFTALATYNFATVFALILIAAAVWGLRPMGCAFFRYPSSGASSAFAQANESGLRRVLFGLGEMVR